MRVDGQRSSARRCGEFKQMKYIRKVSLFIHKLCEQSQCIVVTLLQNMKIFLYLDFQSLVINILIKRCDTQKNTQIFFQHYPEYRSTIKQQNKPTKSPKYLPLFFALIVVFLLHNIIFIK